MAGDASNIRSWETGDVFIFDPDVAFVSGTHVPANIDAALHASWIPVGLIKGDPGVAQDRTITRTDVSSWQQGVVLEQTKDPKATIKFEVLEDNAVTQDLIDPAKVPGIKKRHVAAVFVDDNGVVKRYISKAPVRLFAANNTHSQTIVGTPIDGTLTPVAGEYWTIQEGIPD